jgi:hypothetical protein
MRFSTILGCWMCKRQGQIKSSDDIHKLCAVWGVQFAGKLSARISLANARRNSAGQI